MSSRIQGKPILSTPVRTADAAGSKIVGGTGAIDSRFGGSDGRTICIEDTGTRLPFVAGMGLWLPPLPVPAEGSCPKSEFSKSLGAGKTPGIFPFGGGRGLFVSRVGKASKASVVTMSACVRSDALCARPDRRDLSHLNKCSGAPFAEDGKIRAGSRSCRKFS